MNLTTKILVPGVLVAGVLLAAAPARAQVPDSAFAVNNAGQSLFRVNVDGGATFGGIFDGVDAGLPAEGAGTRMMWHPRKAALRAGRVSGTQWDAASIGDFSVAFGDDSRALGDYSVALGVRILAQGIASFAVGEDNSATGASSVAMGYHAHTNARSGSFVFSDRSSVDTLRAGVNHSANWRVSGGFRIFTSSNLSTGVTIQSGASVSNWGQSSAVISTSTGALLTTGGVWQNASDVNRKHLFRDVSGEDVLARLRSLPIREWSYRAEDASVRHLGPTSQDFRATFGLGSDELSIGTVDADGVALAAAQALEARTAAQAELVAAQAARIQALEQANADLTARLERLEALLAAPTPRP